MHRPRPASDEEGPYSCPPTEDPHAAGPGCRSLHGVFRSFPEGLRQRSRRARPTCCTVRAQAGQVPAWHTGGATGVRWGRREAGRLTPPLRTLAVAASRLTSISILMVPGHATRHVGLAALRILKPHHRGFPCASSSVAQCPSGCSTRCFSHASRGVRCPCSPTLRSSVRLAEPVAALSHP